MMEIVTTALLIIFIIIIFATKKNNKITTNNTNNDNNIEDINDNDIGYDDDKYSINEITQQRLKYMESGNIKTKKIMNIEETRIFYSMVKILNKYSVNPQVSFRAFLKGEKNKESWKTFRDFYCDFLITHKKGSKINEPLAVIEYHGGGHFGDTDKLKEKVKNNDYVREKLFSKIGLKYFIIKDYDIKMKSGLIDEEKLSSLLNDINNIISDFKEC